MYRLVYAAAFPVAAPPAFPIAALTFSPLFMLLLLKMLRYVAFAEIAAIFRGINSLNSG